MAGLGCARAAKRAARKGRVVVVGAGLAGLAAADALDRSGWDVVVLEARDRVGGRCHTARFPNGQVAELGGEYIDTVHRQMRAYAKRFALPLDDLRGVNDDAYDGAVYLHGRRRPYSDVFGAAVQREVDRFYARLDAISARIDPADPVSHGRALDRHSAADLISSLRLSPRARDLIRHQEIRDGFNVEPEHLSLLYMAQTEALYRDVPDSGMEAFRIRGGNQQLPEALAESLGGAVHLEAPVTVVTVRGDRVEVVAGGERVDADACVLAAPLPALRQIAFTPAPPAPLRGAIDHLQYGTGVKTLVQYEERVWNTQGYTGDVFTDLPIDTAWEATDAQRGRAGIIIGYTVGAPGRRFGRLAPGERIAQAEADLNRVFPGSRARAGRAETLSWQGERYTGGAYTAYAPGQVVKYWRALRRTYGPIALAGEHTDAFTGYMEGAVRSGRRAAALIDAA